MPRLHPSAGLLTSCQLWNNKPESTQAEEKLIRERVTIGNSIKNMIYNRAVDPDPHSFSFPDPEGKLSN